MARSRIALLIAPAFLLLLVACVRLDFPKPGPAPSDCTTGATCATVEPCPLKDGAEGGACPPPCLSMDAMPIDCCAGPSAPCFITPLPTPTPCGDACPPEPTPCDVVAPDGWIVVCPPPPCDPVTCPPPCDPSTCPPCDPAVCPPQCELIPCPPCDPSADGSTILCMPCDPGACPTPCDPATGVCPPEPTPCMMVGPGAEPSTCCPGPAAECYVTPGPPPTPCDTCPPPPCPLMEGGSTYPCPPCGPPNLGMPCILAPAAR